MPDPNFFPLVLPVLVLVAYALLALVMSPAFRGQSWILGPVSLIGVGMAGWFTRELWISWRMVGPMQSGFGMVRVDGFGLFAASILLVITALSILATFTAIRPDRLLYIFMRIIHARIDDRHDHPATARGAPCRRCSHFV